MLMFKLTPIKDRLSDPIWRNSDPPHEPCFAIGETENDARDNAATNFRPMRERVGFEKITCDSPWLDPAITICEHVGESVEIETWECFAVRESEIGHEWEKGLT